MGKKIRYRERVNSSPPEGRRQSWGEYQVVEGRRVIGRYDLLEQAKKAHPEATEDESCK